MIIRAVFLDFYGTVVEEDDKYIGQICSKIADSSSKHVSASEVGYFWQKDFFASYTNSYGDTFKKQRELQISSLEKTISHFQSSGDAKELCSVLFSYGQKPIIFKESKDFIDKVTMPVIIVSNIDNEDIMLAIEEHKIDVDEIITSEDAKSYKPRTEIYKLALDVMGFDASEVIHIGDSWNSDIIGAKDAGIRSIWVNRKNKKIRNDAKPVGICNNLLDAIGYFT